MGAAARRMHLLARDTIAGTHRSDAFAPAFTDADAALRGAREAPVIVARKFEVSLQFRRAIIDSIAEVLIGAISVDDFPGIHLPIGVPDRFELAKRLHQLGSEHLGKQFATRLAVAVLARERTAVADHEIRRRMNE